MGFEDEVEQSLGRPCRLSDGRSKRTYELTSSIVPQGTSFHRAVELEWLWLARKPIDKGYLYRVLNNRVYVGKAMHKGTEHPGEHDAIIEQSLWDQVHELISESPRKRSTRSRGRTPAILKGLIFGPTGAAMTPAHTRKRGRLYRYYISTDVIRNGPCACPIRRVPAARIEAVVIAQIKTMVQTPEIIVATWRAARQSIKGLTETQVKVKPCGCLNQGNRI